MCASVVKATLYTLDETGTLTESELQTEKANMIHLSLPDHLMILELRNSIRHS